MGGKGISILFLVVLSSSAVFPQVPSTLYHCDLENGLCGLMQDKGDDFDWIYHQGKTQSYSTGPTTDHTKRSTSGHYYYIDASKTYNFNNAVLVSPSFSAASSDFCLKFYYHMYGDVMGRLNVKILEEGKPPLTVWTKAGNQGNQWHEAKITFPQRNLENNYKFLFEASRGTGVASDIAIDDITLKQGSCYNGGYYFVADAKGVDKNPDKTAFLISPSFPSVSSESCLKFYYHMNGKNIGDLSVKIISGTQEYPELWKIRGDLGNQWNLGEVTLPALQLQNDFKIQFETERNSADDNGVAIDDVTLQSGSCCTPASCSFESGLCTFTQLGRYEDTLNWVKKKGGSGTVDIGPSSDHTYGSSVGTYMYLYAASIFTRAGEIGVLKSERLPATNGSCLTFWYHMYGDGIGALNISIGKSLKEKENIWSLSGPQQNKWLRAQAPVVSPKSSFFIYVEGISGEGGSEKVSIDDIIYQNVPCKTLPFYANAIGRATYVAEIQFNCKFENDFCDWKQDNKNDEFDWQRQSSKSAHTSTITVPTQYHTADDGAFVFISSSVPRKEGDKAAIISPSLFGPMCVSFWYYMSGDTLKVYSDSTLIWSKQGSQGKQWNYANISINVNTLYKISFEAVVGSESRGDIAIDDISAKIGECPTPTLHFFCNFEYNFCAWKQEDKKDAFDWQRRTSKVAHTSTVTGPTHDHTGDNGAFAFIDSSHPRKEGDNATLISPTLTGPMCVSFWYFMWGDQVNALKVYNDSTLIWLKQGSQGKQWNQANIFINVTTSYKISIEAVVGSVSRGDIAIDDVSTKIGECPQSPAGIQGPTCDFENGTCGYVQASYDDFDWLRESYEKSRWKFGPDMDHTYGSRFGTYMHLDNRARSDMKADLVSCPINVGESDLCLEFWYLKEIDKGCVLSVAVRRDLFADKVIWKEKDYHGGVWIQAQVDIANADGEFKLVFSAIKSGVWHNDLYIDDIVLRKGKCLASQTNGTCDFENNLCGWTNNKTDKMEWVFGQGSTQFPSDVPTVDHTIGYATGKYIFINNYFYSIVGDSAVLYSELFPSQLASCFQFYYNMYGKTIGTLRIWLATYDASLDNPLLINQRVIWEISGKQSKGWKEGQVPIPQQNEHFRIFLEGIQVAYEKVEIALDDFTFTPGDKQSCVVTPSEAEPVVTTVGTTTSPTTTHAPPDEPQLPYTLFDCNFENPCGFKQDKDGAFVWTPYQGSTQSSETGPSVDHTLGSTEGHYYYTEASDYKPGDKAVLVSSYFQGVSSNACLNFFYHMFGSNMGELSVKINPKGSDAETLWTKKGDQNDQWNKGEITFPQANLENGFTFQFEAIRGDGFKSDIAIDDITLQEGNCNDPGDTSSLSSLPFQCSFEEICGFVQGESDGTYTWFHHYGSTSTEGTGPEADHTHGSGIGHYFYANACSVKDHAKTQLVSPSFPATSSDVCLRFYYHMYGTEMGGLSVKIRGAGGTTKTPWTKKGNQGNQWHKAEITFPAADLETEFQIIFEAQRGTKDTSDIAIDDIILEQGSCNYGDASADTDKV